MYGFLPDRMNWDKRLFTFCETTTTEHGSEISRVVPGGPVRRRNPEAALPYPLQAWSCFISCSRPVLTARPKLGWPWTGRKGTNGGNNIFCKEQREAEMQSRLTILRGWSFSTVRLGFGRIVRSFSHRVGILELSTGIFFLSFRDYLALIPHFDPMRRLRKGFGQP
jgi:hypothetical protein